MTKLLKYKRSLKDCIVQPPLAQSSVNQIRLLMYMSCQVFNISKNTVSRNVSVLEQMLCSVELIQSSLYLVPLPSQRRPRQYVLYQHIIPVAYFSLKATSLKLIFNDRLTLNRNEWLPCHGQFVFFFFPEVENMTDFRFILSVKGTLDQIKFNAQEYIF